MTLLLSILAGLETFARGGWSGGPFRAVPMSPRALADLAIAHFCVVLLLGVAMCGLATVSALVLRLIL